MRCPELSCEAIDRITARHGPAVFVSISLGGPIPNLVGEKYLHVDRQVCSVCGVTWDAVLDIEGLELVL